MTKQAIHLKNVRVHNLKSVDVTLKPHQLIVCTGVSGSGKSSLAFDTLFAEGQRRYVESLGNYARRQLGEMSKPDVEHVSGLSPTISIEQKTAGRNPRSTVGTMTEVYDYLRVLYARVATAYCPVSGEAVMPQSKEQILQAVQALEPGSRVLILAPFAQGRKGEFREEFQDLLRKGFMRVRVDGEVVSLDGELSLDGSLAHDVDVLVDRLVISEDSKGRTTESLMTALDLGEGLCRIAFADEEAGDELLFSIHAYSPQSGLSYEALEPHDFSFNSPKGMCPRCQGLGEILEFQLDKIIDPSLSISENCCSIASAYETVRFGNIYDNLARLYHFKVSTPWKKLPESARHVFLYGTEKKWTRMRFVHPVTGSTWSDHVQWRGVLYEAHRRFTEAKSDSYKNRMSKVMHQQRCPDCQGGRLAAYPAAARLGGRSLPDLCALTVADALRFIESIALEGNDAIIAEELLKEINQRLQFLLGVGLHYLTLDRGSPTLSGGEAQRVRLASQIGCGLVGVTYVLDEPSIGLHPRDNHRLIETMKRLRDMGNTVVVVEHDEDTILAANHILDFGPGPGVRGGELVVDGSLKALLSCRRSLTADYITGRKVIPIPEERRRGGKEKIRITGAQHHNLKDLNIDIPLGVFVAVTGVSGSGKSSLVTDILYPALANVLHRAELTIGKHKNLTGLKHIDKVIAIDQSPIGRNPRSNPSTYIKLFDEIRDLFASLPESKARGYSKGRFSFNVKEGSCPRCHGMGLVKVDMDFMEDAWVDCPMCLTRRFDNATLSVRFKGKSIYDVLEMDVGEALHFFENIPSLHHKLSVLSSVGMEYIKLGQPSTTLSGGEAQRIKLAKELVRPATGRTLYIFDEPTTGLHFHDIKHLLAVLQELVDRGNTVLVIEHNMDVVKTADWILDLGPEGGEGGGQLIAKGTPEAIAALETPTGLAMRKALDTDRAKHLKKARSSSDSKSVSVQNLSVAEAYQNNLKGVDLSIPRNKLTVFTGPSGSGKSSLAFDTIYAEGQRRYTESLSPYARQFVKQMPKPNVGQVDGLSPAIAIEQKAHAGNPRSTVGTMTELYDYLRILYARVGVPHCPETGEVIRAVSKDHVVDTILNYPQGERLHILAPLELRRNEDYRDVLKRYRRQGFLRVRLNNDLYELHGTNGETSDAVIEDIPYDRRKKNTLFLVVDRLKADPSSKSRLFEAVEVASAVSQGKLVVMRESSDESFNLAFSVPSTGKSYPEVTPHTFSFNSAEGMCQDCQGIGTQYGVKLDGNSPLLKMSVLGLFHAFWADNFTRDAEAALEDALAPGKIDLYKPLDMLPKSQLDFFLNGPKKDRWERVEPKLQLQWAGLNNVLGKAAKASHRETRERVVPLLDESPCLSCGGGRLNALARHVTIDGLSITELCQRPSAEALTFFQKIQLSEVDAKLLDEVLQQLINRLSFLCEVGLHYLSLERRAPTLSGGEAQRIRLARQLGSSLTGVLYVLDEPTIGLHPHDNDKLNAALAKLKALGNTLLMVEHDPLTIATADYVVDFGPHAGEHGGNITAKGTYKQILRSKESLTGQYLSGRKTIATPKRTRQVSNGYALVVTDANLHNLKKVNVSFPSRALSCVTGVSGSGKSTLVNDIVRPAVLRGLGVADTIVSDKATVSGIDQFDQLIVIDQNPIGRTSRADVGTYVDALSPMRDFFAALPLARAKGLSPAHFSTNHRRGMCTHCWGMGYRRVELHFLPAIRVQCEHCKGLRLNPISLEVSYAEKNFGKHLNTTVEEARRTFDAHKRITRILDTLIDVGLGYLKLGQKMATLSGGEAQRIKLSRELSKRSRGNTLYLLDEPTTGLHSDDIAKLLTVLQNLVDKGNTMIIIEHNLDVIKNADYIIDMGPEAGERGGKVICMGSPHTIAKSKRSLTGKYLRAMTEDLNR